MEDEQGRPIANGKLTLWVGRWTIVRPTRKDGTQAMLLPVERASSTLVITAEAPGYHRIDYEFDPTAERKFIFTMKRGK
jgi:hypothetical protein